MENSNSTNELSANQNKLLEQTNNLLERQNQILQQHQISSTAPREVFVKDIERDEMRDGFLVTSHRKKLWNAQIGLIKEFARVCEKHNLRWFAYGGTLLGAVRHKGYIPWDDDVDIAMLRPDYEKFRKIAVKELNPYYVDFWYNYKFESEGGTLTPNDGLCLVTKNHEQQIYNQNVMWPCWPIIKIKDSTTTQLQYFDRKHVHQGIFIDVFPLDPVPPFSDSHDSMKFAALKELFMATNYPRIVRKVLENNNSTLVGREELETFMELPFSERALSFEESMAKNFFKSKYVGEIRDHCVVKAKSYRSIAFDETIYLPFEQIELPVPVGYDDVLTDMYGDWHKMVFTHTHSQEWSVDIPYTEYYKKSALMRQYDMKAGDS